MMRVLSGMQGCVLLSRREVEDRQRELFMAQGSPMLLVSGGI